MEYSYGFDEDLQQEWEWTERYATAAGDPHYANHVADRFDLRRDIQLSTRVTARGLRRGDRRAGRSTTDQGDEVSARFLVMATGCLSAANIPDIPGAGVVRGPDVPHRSVAP